MRKFNIALICSVVLLLAACSKDNDGRAPLTNGSISFQLAADKDTIEMPLSILKDSAIVLGIKAALTGSTSPTEHWVSFAVDTTKIGDYRARYGSALLMPTSSYVFYKPTTRIAPGSSLSDSAQINIGAQTKLTEYSTYVLPIVIQSVDGLVEGPATTRVLYIVIKTGKPLFVNKTGWTIAGFSSQYAPSLAPTMLLDNITTTTYWGSDIAQEMPQWVSINFNRDVTFLAVNYSLPTALRYPTLGGYPTSIKIETSMNGTDWVDKGTYAGNITNNLQSLPVGETTARYLRFTSLSVVKYNNANDAVFISDISLVP